ncbi:conserved hypothetical protein [Bradyrhizobium sp. STM 3843]|uniref:hypothetical protein n=1 Tax=Bradyrhizobium sp. STM 3843 TaxID=551947 RepID=UPI000240369A|nr:hypothetical protein [Bradyrhizobium sp. STM 3843]CCE08415.1 conserved hypothetical protein [Bradyrhizobium sp. STM 3843]
MTELEKAEHFLSVLTSAQAAAPQTALQLLNGVIGLAKSAGGTESIEVDEARASALLAICEVGKALHRGQPTEALFAKAFTATEGWVSLVR